MQKFLIQFVQNFFLILRKATKRARAFQEWQQFYLKEPSKRKFSVEKENEKGKKRKDQDELCRMMNL